MTTQRPPYRPGPGQRPPPQARPTQQRPAQQAQRGASDVENPAWQLATAMLGVLHDIAEMQYRANSLLADLIALQEDTDLYCPPSEHCPGGILLRHSTVFADDLPPEKRRDKFYHPLPEAAYYDIVDKDKTLHVRNHVVWRSRALRAAANANPDEDRMPPEERAVTNRPPARTAVSAKAAEPTPGIAIAGSTITVETWEKVGPLLRATTDRFKGEVPEARALYDYMTEEITAREAGDTIHRAASIVRSFMREREGGVVAFNFTDRSDADAVDLGEALTLFEREWDAQATEEVTREPIDPS